MSAQDDRQSAGIADKTKEPTPALPSTSNGDAGNAVIIRSID